MDDTLIVDVVFNGSRSTTFKYRANEGWPTCNCGMEAESRCRLYSTIPDELEFQIRFRNSASEMLHLMRRLKAISSGQYDVLRPEMITELMDVPSIRSMGFKNADTTDFPDHRSSGLDSQCTLA
jgi:hypothetical protein